MEIWTHDPRALKVRRIELPTTGYDVSAPSRIWRGGREGPGCLPLTFPSPTQAKLAQGGVGLSGTTENLPISRCWLSLVVVGRSVLAA